MPSQDIERRSVQILPSDARHVLISLNPNSGSVSGKPLADDLTAHLRQRNFLVELVMEPAVLAKRSAELSATGNLRAVVSAGGDGTAAMVVNLTPVGTPLAILPLGTENLLAKYLEITDSAAEVAERIQQGCTVNLDAGQAENRVFLLMVGVGFDAEVVRQLHETRTGNIRHLTYLKPLLNTLRRYRYPEIRIQADTGERMAPPTTSPLRLARWAFVVNLPKYAFGLKIAPAAKGTDNLLDVCTFQGGSLISSLRYVAGVITGKHRSWRDCETFQTKRIRIESDEEVPYQLDGDPGGHLPVEISVLPERLTVLISETWASRHGFDKPK